MCKNTRISGLKFGLITSLLNMSTSPTLYSEMPGAIFCFRDDKDVKILPGNILSEGKKMRTSWEIVLQFWSHSRYWLFFTESRLNYLCCVLRNRGGSGIFFRKGCIRLLLYFNTNKPHSFFLAEYQLYWKTAGHLRGGVRTPCTLPLDLPLRNGFQKRCLLCQ